MCDSSYGDKTTTTMATRWERQRAGAVHESDSEFSASSSDGEDHLQAARGPPSYLAAAKGGLHLATRKSGMKHTEWSRRKEKSGASSEDDDDDHHRGSSRNKKRGYRRERYAEKQAFHRGADQHPGGPEDEDAEGAMQEHAPVVNKAVLHLAMAFTPNELAATNCDYATMTLSEKGRDVFALHKKLSERIARGEGISGVAEVLAEPSSSRKHSSASVLAAAAAERMMKLDDDGGFSLKLDVAGAARSLSAAKGAKSSSPAEDEDIDQHVTILGAKIVSVSNKTQHHMLLSVAGVPNPVVPGHITADGRVGHLMVPAGESASRLDVHLVHEQSELHPFVRKYPGWTVDKCDRGITLIKSSDGGEPRVTVQAGHPVVAVLNDVYSTRNAHSDVVEPFIPESLANQGVYILNESIVKHGLGILKRAIQSNVGLVKTSDFGIRIAPAYLSERRSEAKPGSAWLDPASIACPPSAVPKALEAKGSVHVALELTYA